MSNSIQHFSHDRVFVSMSRTINLGNYNNVKFEVGYNTDVTPPEKVSAAFARAEAQVQSELEKLERHLNQKGGGK